MRTNTDLGFSGPILKYERFDPPPVNIINNITNDNNIQQVPSSNLNANDKNHFKDSDSHLSPGCGKPNPLDLDLMSDLQDIINRKTPLLESASQFRQGESWTPVDCSNGIVAQSKEEPVSDLILLNNGDMMNQTKLQQCDVDPEVIFDPLLQHTSEINPSDVSNMMQNNLRSTGLPRPPSKSSIQHIARSHNLQQQEINQFQHQPLARAFEPNTKGDISFRFGTNPFVQTTEISSANVNEEHGAFHRVVNRNSNVNKCNVPVNTRHLYSKSSENLLKEYGLDFSKLSMAGNVETQQDGTPSHKYKPQHQPIVQHSQNNTSTISGKNMDIFADLDPLGKKVKTDNFRPVPPPRPSQPPPLRPVQTNNGSNTVNKLVDLTAFDLDICDPQKTPLPNTTSKPILPPSMETFPSPPPPIVPPRTRKLSQNSTRPTQSKWTTFE